MADDTPMSDTQNVLDYLREQFTRVHGEFRQLALWREETTKRLTAIERHIAAVRRDAVLDAESVVDVQERLDTLMGRVERIERRLDLADASSHAK